MNYDEMVKCAYEDIVNSFEKEAANRFFRDGNENAARLIQQRVDNLAAPVRAIDDKIKNSTSDVWMRHYKKQKEALLGNKIYGDGLKVPSRGYETPTYQAYVKEDGNIGQKLSDYSKHYDRNVESFNRKMEPTIHWSEATNNTNGADIARYQMRQNEIENRRANKNMYRSALDRLTLKGRSLEDIKRGVAEGQKYGYWDNIGELPGQKRVREIQERRAAKAAAAQRAAQTEKRIGLVQQRMARRKADYVAQQAAQAAKAANPSVMGKMRTLFKRQPGGAV